MSQIALDELLKKIYRSVEAIIGEPLKDVFLYGSYARGDYDAESDIDIALIINAERQKTSRYRKELVDLMSDLSLQNDIVICITCIPQSEFEEYKEILPYYKNISNEGVRLSA